MIEKDIQEMRRDVDWIKRKLAELSIYLIPDKRDYSQQSDKAKELVKVGKKPRKQPKKKEEFRVTQLFPSQKR